MEAFHHHQTAIDYNNMGLSQWDSGEGLGAIELLFSAYRHCIKSFRCPSSISGVNGAQQTANFSVNASIESSLRAMREKQELTNNVIHKGICIPTSPEVVNNPSDANKSMILCAIVFNLAVVHHVATKWGTVEIPTSLREKFQRTSIDFYQMGLQLQQEISSCGMYTIAILNNLAHLYFDLGESEKSEFYFSEMVSRISALEEAITGECDSSHHHASTTTTTKLQKIVSTSAAPAA